MVKKGEEMNTDVNPGGLALIVVMPVYNEGAVIRTVVEDWLRVLVKLGVSCRLRVRNDGSTDDTAEQLGAVRHPMLEVIDSENRGHGPTLLAEYSRAFGEAEWVFQTDSDGELSAEDFQAFWEHREEADFLIGVRQNRGGPLSRRVITRGLRLVLRFLFGGDLQDGNCPFRLMRSEAFRPALELIPGDAFAPNVLLSGFALRAGLRIDEKPVSFRPRSTGTVSIRRGKLFRAACVSAVQTRRFSGKLGEIQTSC
jgi:dolichol-phosphate mannosyltransferase